jgi:hypothetical protein
MSRVHTTGRMSVMYWPEGLGAISFSGLNAAL